MKQIFGFLVIAWIAVIQIIEQTFDILSIASFLGALCLFIIKEKYLDRPLFSLIFFIGAIIVAQYNDTLLLLAAIPLIDFAYARHIYAAAAGLAAASYLIAAAGYYYYIPIMLCAVLTGYILGIKHRNEQKNIDILDGERRLRYELEQAQNALIKSRSEIENLTEARERNRIAHELHDSIGHAIAGIKMQIEAAIRISDKEGATSKEILLLCSKKLSETLELIRNTVYNIRTSAKTGIEVLEKIINGFSFCPVTFEHSGDFNNLSASNLQIIETIITEALTNSSKHARASAINIKIDISRRSVRLYYCDNGIGCDNIQEGLGLLGMRSRIKNAGGTISIDGSNGFLIVCNLPEHSYKYEGGENNENSYS